MKSISVIVCTYNWPEALELSLQSLLAQDYHGQYEILIADDGSTAATAELINKLQRSSTITIKHIWQEDVGFRLAMCRNRALLQATGEYIIFIDGDCVPTKDFLRQHVRIAQQGYFVSGSRILLAQNFSNKVLQQKIAVQDFGLLTWLKLFLTKQCNRFSSLFRLGLNSWRCKYYPRQLRGIKGCNLAMWHQDLRKVNGWESSITGWGYEDTELGARLMNIGVYRKYGGFAALVFHIWHPENSRANSKNNELLCNNVIKDHKTRATMGLQQCLK